MGREKKQKSSKKQKHKHKHKKEKKKSKKSQRRSEEKIPKTSTTEEKSTEEEKGFEIPIELMNTKSHAPESKEEYDRRQSKIRHEKDPVTGRIRLIKGDSEILEEIVSRDRSRKINKAATENDGEYFQTQSVAKRRN